MFANVKCGGSISVQQVLPELGEIFLRGRAWHQSRSSWGQLPPRTRARRLLPWHDDPAVAAFGAPRSLLYWGACHRIEKWRIGKSIGTKPTWLAQGLRGPLGNRRAEVGKPTGGPKRGLRGIQCLGLLRGSACYRSGIKRFLIDIGTIFTWLTQGLKGPLGNRRARVGCPTRR